MASQDWKSELGSDLALLLEDSVTLSGFIVCFRFPSRGRAVLHLWVWWVGASFPYSQRASHGPMEPGSIGETVSERIH